MSLTLHVSIFFACYNLLKNLFLRASKEVWISTDKVDVEPLGDESCSPGEGPLICIDGIGAGW